MTSVTISTDTLAQTENAAHRLSQLVRAGDVVALWGGLGAGKTTFCRFLITACMGAPTDVPSPTYTLVQTYDAPAFPIFHFDLFRLRAPEEVFELGWDETPEGLALIEWPERAGPHLPEWRLDVRFEMAGDSRTLTLEPRGEDWQTRIHGY